MAIQDMATNLQQRRAGVPVQPIPGQAAPPQQPPNPAQVIESVKVLLAKALELISSMGAPQQGG
jgi:hypothetical protein